MAIVLEQKWAPFIVLACKGKNKEPVWLQTQKCLILWKTGVRHEGKAVKYGTFT